MAFDTVDHKILLRMLASYGIEHRALTWFNSYLNDRQRKCVVSGELSGARAVTSVVSHRVASLVPFFPYLY